MLQTDMVRLYIHYNEEVVQPALRRQRRNLASRV